MTKSDLDISNIVAMMRNRVSVDSDYYYNKLPRDLRQLAFTVSGLEKLREIEMVKRSLANALEKGESFKEWRDNVNIPGLKALSNQRLETVYRMNINSVYNQSARYNAWESDVTPYLMYTAIGDDRTRPSHMALDGTVKRADSAFWDKFTPPWDWNCTASYQKVSGKFNKGFRSFYKGDMVSVELKSGKFISITPNHPVATEFGFKAAQHLNPGAKVFIDNGEVGINAVSGNINDNNWTTSSNLFKSMFLKAFSFTKSSSFNFYGDIEFMDKKVDVVTVNGFLTSDLEIGKTTKNFIFKFTDNRIRNILFNIVRSCSLIKNNILFFKKNFYETFRNIKNLRDLFGAFKITFIESFGFFFYMFNIFSKKFLASYIPWFKSTRQKSSIDSVSTNAELITKFKDASSSFKEFDEVINIKFYPYFGFVYDFESIHGMLITDGLVTSNCRCGVVPMDKETADEIGISRRSNFANDTRFKSKKMGDVLSGVTQDAEQAIKDLPRGSPFREKFKEQYANIKNLVDIWFNKNKDIFTP